MLKKFLLTMGIAVGGFLVSVVLHNVVSDVFGVEEPVFFLVAVIICPLAFFAGAIGSIVSALGGRRS